MTRRLYIHHRERTVGLLEEWRFQYDRAWLDSDGFALSSSLPLSSAAYSQPARHWFANLLPEGGARERIAQRLRLDADDDFALLEALGGECAGAVTLDPEPEWRPAPNEDPDAMYRLLTEDELTSMAKFRGLGPLLQGKARLSLAGAQDKLPVRVDEEGHFYIPVGAAASTHLLKFGNREDAGLVENELLCLEVARRVGLPVVSAQPRRISGETTLLIRRYDRIIQAPTSEHIASTSRIQLPPVTRIHQEDFAQALGLSRRQKYEEGQGPNLADCANLIRDNGLSPANEIRTLIRWVAYNFAIGNRDNHAKNLSRRLDRESGRWALVPFYDLVNTTGYRRLSPQLAFSIGGQQNAHRITRRHWEKMANALGVAPRLVLREVDSINHSVAEHLSPATAATGELLGSKPSVARLAQLRRAIGKTLAMARRLVEG